jgi:hypothetical protein
MPRVSRDLANALTLGLVLCSGACTSSRVINRPGTVTQHQEVNRDLSGRNAELRMRTGELYSLYSLEVEEDSVFGVLRYGNGSQRVPLADVLEIRTGKDRMSGGIRGAAIGGAVGLVLGFVGYSPQATRDSCPGCSRSEFGVQMTIGGALWGVMIGAIQGDRIRYVVGR